MICRQCSTDALPLGIKAVENGCSKKCGSISLERKTLIYKIFIFIFTFWMYTSYKMTRRPFSVVKIALCPPCAKDNITGYSNLSSSGAYLDGWPPFNSTSGKTLLGSIDYTLVFSHAIGLYISGYIADRMNLRYFICIGMFSSGVITVFLGLGYFLQVHHLAYFLVLQILSGLLQSTGWPGLQGVTAKWFGKKNRGVIIGVWSSCSFAGSIMGYVIPSFFINSENEADSPWGWSFIAPALITMVTAVIAFFVLVTDPGYLGLNPPVQEIVVEEEEKESSITDDGGGGDDDAGTRLVEDGEDEAKEMNMSESSNGSLSVHPIEDDDTQTSSNAADPKVVKSKAVGFIRALFIPGVVEYSLSLFCIKLITYSFDYWLPFYVSVSYPDFGGKRAAWLATLFNFGGITGGLIIGGISDRITSLRSIILLPMLVSGIPVIFIFREFGDVSIVFFSFLVFLIGVFINGPHIIIVGAVSNDLGTHKTLKEDQHAKSIVSGIIDGTGAIGAAIGPLLVGIFTDKFGWNSIFYLMMVTCSLSALILMQ